MSRAFDMELFLAGFLTGAHATRQRHLRQAKAIQTAIAERWQRDNPWTWQKKHLTWFLNHHVYQHAESTRYYYLLTVHLLAHRLGKAWQFNRQAKVNNRPRLCKNVFERDRYSKTDWKSRIYSKPTCADVPINFRFNIDSHTSIW
jgi:hypothetical protein